MLLSLLTKNREEETGELTKRKVKVEESQGRGGFFILSLQSGYA